MEKEIQILLMESITWFRNRGLVIAINGHELSVTKSIQNLYGEDGYLNKIMFR